MPIEFHCSGCQKVLRVPDDAAGKKAKCPQCGMVIAVPLAAPPATPSISPAPSVPVAPSIPVAPNVVPPQPASGNPFGNSPIPAVQTSNPYQAPGVGFSGGTVTMAEKQPLAATIISIGAVWDHAWATFQRNMGPLVLSMLALMGIGIGFYIVMALLAGLVFVASGGPDRAGPMLPLLQIGMTLLFFPFFLWLQAGQVRYCVRVARGGEPQLGDLFRGAEHILPLLGMMISAYIITILVMIIPALLFGGAIAAAGTLGRDAGPVVRAVVMIVGLVLFAVFNIWFQLGLSQGMFLVVDRRLGPIDALQRSWQITRGNRLSLLALAFISFFIHLAGILMCGIGVLFTTPLLVLIWTVAYLMMTGQQLVAPRS